MKVRSILLEENDLREYIKKHWRGFDTKDYELLTAMLLARFHTIQFGGTFHIGFPIKVKTDSEVPNEYVTGNIEWVLQGFIEEDTPIDISMVSEKDMEPWPTGETERAKTGGRAFQLKRFAVREGGDLTGSIVGYLQNDIAKNYAAVQAGLVLVVGGGKTSGSFDLDKIKDNFKPQRFPFERVMFITGGVDKIVFGEIWPNHGYVEYPSDELFGDLLDPPSPLAS
jgi:hypothetical protein